MEFEVQRILDKRADVKCVAWGGHASAERSRLIFGPEEMMYEATHDPAALGLIAAVQVLHLQAEKLNSCMHKS